MPYGVIHILVFDFKLELGFCYNMHLEKLLAFIKLNQ
jgi:hypothetical protein